MKSVLVMMSTYNGHKYLSEQINSILRQKDVLVHLLIRDDGSQDDTVKIIKSFQDTNSNITLLTGNNLGFAQSFMSLVYEAEKYDNFDYFAFSDQDDIWLDDKLIKAIDKLYPLDHSKPLLYFSNTTAVDDSLKPMFITHPPCVLITKKSSLVRYLMLGCTMVMSRQTIDILSAYKPKYPVLMHDLWINQTCAFFGEIIYDPEPHILYRQHGNNTAGVSFSLVTRIKRFIKSFKSYEHRHFREYNAKNLLCTYKAILSKDDIMMVSRVANYRNSFKDRLSLLFSSEYNMDTILSTLVIKFRILLGFF